MMLITVYQRRSKRNGGGGSRSEKSQHKGFHRWYGRRIGEWPTRECHKTLSGPWRVGQNGLRRSHENGESLKEVGPGGWKNGFPWWWRRCDSGHVRRPKRWQPLFFDSLRQHCHSLRGGRGWRASWPASFSLRRPPIRTEMGVREIAQRRTSPRRSCGNKSAAWSAWRLLKAILTKAKNTKGPNSICFF